MFLISLSLLLQKYCRRNIHINTGSELEQAQLKSLLALVYPLLLGVGSMCGIQAWVATGAI